MSTKTLEQSTAPLSAAIERTKASGRASAMRTKLLMLISDFLLVWFTGLFVIWAWLLERQGDRNVVAEFMNSQHLHLHLGVLLLYSVLVVTHCQSQHLYRLFETRSTTQEFLALCRAFGLATGLMIAFVYIGKFAAVSRFVVVASAGCGLATCTAVRYYWRVIARREVAEGRHCQNVLIFGMNEVGAAVAKQLEAQQHLGYRVVGFLDRTPGPGVLGSVEQVQDVIGQYFIDEIFVTVPSAREAVKAIARTAREMGVTVRIVTDLYDGVVTNGVLQYVSEFPTLTVTGYKHRSDSFAMKRLFDMAAAAFALLIVGPVLALIAIAIRLDSPGPILYRSRRVGKKGHTFTFYKFRTMVDRADGMQNALQHLNERDGLLFKISDDPRVTRVGRFLRKYSLDELPQFWNVLIGDMSIVGPRPPIPGEYEQYTNLHRQRLHIMPGITGLWQVSARQDPSFDRYISLDSEYIANWSLLLDLKIILRTIAVVFDGTGK